MAPACRFPFPQNPLPSAPKRFRISCPSGRGPLGRRNKAQCVCLSVCLSVCPSSTEINSSLCDVCVSGRCHPRCTTMSTADPILSPPSRPSCLPRDAAMHGDVMAWVSVCQVSVWPHVCVCRSLARHRFAAAQCATIAAERVRPPEKPRTRSSFVLELEAASKAVR